MQERLAAKVDAGRRDPLELELRGRPLERPRLVRDLRGDQPAAPLREEAVTLDEEVLERRRLGASDRPAGA